MKLVGMFLLATLVFGGKKKEPDWIAGKIIAVETRTSADAVTTPLPGRDGVRTSQREYKVFTVHGASAAFEIIPEFNMMVGQELQFSPVDEKCLDSKGKKRYCRVISQRLLSDERPKDQPK